MGALVSLIDVGGLLSTRLSGKSGADGATTDDPVRLKNILSLGGYVHFSFGRSPVVGGFGYAVSPALRRAELVNGQHEDLKSSRWLLFVATDITIFPL